jgi:hexulose-6-phosphate isomerase
MPFVDNSAIHNQDELNQLIEIISPLLEKVWRAGITLVLETTLPHDMFRAFLLELNHSAARANYDTGNSASLGFNPSDEMIAYGEYIVTVHVKDRVLKGGTVPLGTGGTDFDTCFSILSELGYNGPYILQAARGDDEILWSKKNKDFIMKYL